MHLNERFSTCVFPGAGSRSPAGLDTSACTAPYWGVRQPVPGSALARRAIGMLRERWWFGPGWDRRRPRRGCRLRRSGRTAQQHAAHAHRGPLTAAYGADTAVVQLVRDLPEAHAGLTQLGHHGPDAPSEVVGGLRSAARPSDGSTARWLPLATQRLTLLSPCAGRASPMS